MLHRSASSRRRRASRSVTGPSATSAANAAAAVAAAAQQQQPQQQQQQQQPRSRRASLASSEPAAEAAACSRSAMDRQRSPRGSCVPNIALDSEERAPDEMFARRLLPDPEQFGASRLSLAAPETARGSRNSLLPDEYAAACAALAQGCRSPRASSARNSLVPEMSRSPRHSLVPESLSPRNSLVPLDAAASYNRSPRGSIAPLMGARSPRHSLVPDVSASRSPRGSVAAVDFERPPQERSPRGSVCPELQRSPRGSISPMDVKERSPRGSIAGSDCANLSPRGSICPLPEPPGGRSPRGSIAAYETQARSPRGSIAGHRGSLTDDEAPGLARSPRGSIGGGDLERSPRGSFAQERRMPPSARSTAAPQQEPRRHSQDQGTPKAGGSAYRRQQQQQRDENSGSLRSVGNAAAGAQVNLAYSWSESRRPSSSVSQFSGDESRRLCESRSGAGGSSGLEKGYNTTGAGGGGVGGGSGGGGPGGGIVGVAAYGSLVFQLKDAHLEANGTCDFVLRGLRVLSKTTPVTLLLGLLSCVPIIMLILGVQFYRDCPREPRIPDYMIVGGTLGSIRMFWTLYSQIRSRRPEVLSMPGSRSRLSPTTLISFALSCFLIGWFVLGNYWILNIRWPDYAPTLFEPNRWCHKTLYVFSLLHLFIVYLVIALSLFTGLGLLFCRILACPWPERYK